MSLGLLRFAIIGAFLFGASSCGEEEKVVLDISDFAGYYSIPVSDICEVAIILDSDGSIDSMDKGTCKHSPAVINENSFEIDDTLNYEKRLEAFKLVFVGDDYVLYGPAFSAILPDRGTEVGYFDLLGHYFGTELYEVPSTELQVFINPVDEYKIGFETLCLITPDCNLGYPDIDRRVFEEYVNLGDQIYCQILFSPSCFSDAVIEFISHMRQS